jgi:hypothetical protein
MSTSDHLSIERCDTAAKLKEHYKDQSCCVCGHVGCVDLFPEGPLCEACYKKFVPNGSPGAEPPDVEELAPCIVCGATPCHVLHAEGPLCDGCVGFPASQLLKTKPVPKENPSKALGRTNAKREIGPSPYPCPRCRAVIKITCSYQGRREEWSCGHCNFGWSMNASPEQST